MVSVSSWIVAAHQAPTLGHIVHIGAGLCDDLSDYLKDGATAVILVEPDPATAGLLREKTGTHSQVSVIEAAISNGEHGQLLNRFSFADLNSLRTPTGLTQIFPALEVLSQEPVKIQNPVELMQGLNLSETDDNMLVIEAPGEAMDILRALENAQFLQLFKYLRISEGREALYQGATLIDEIHAWLGTRFFAGNVFWDYSDPDLPTLSLVYDDAAAKQARFEVELAETKTDLIKATQAAEETNAQLKAFQNESDQNANKAKAKAAEFVAEIEALQQQLAPLQLEIQRNANARDAHLAQIAALQQQVSSLTDERDLTQQEQIPMNAKIKAAEHNLGMSLRIQSLRETDLKDLQNRYKTLLAEKDAQAELLGRLTASLSNAAHYLQDMEDAPPERISTKPTKRKKTAARKTKKAATSDE